MDEEQHRISRRGSRSANVGRTTRLVELRDRFRALQCIAGAHSDALVAIADTATLFGSQQRGLANVHESLGHALERGGACAVGAARQAISRTVVVLAAELTKGVLPGLKLAAVLERADRLVVTGGVVGDLGRAIQSLAVTVSRGHGLALSPAVDAAALALDIPVRQLIDKVNVMNGAARLVSSEVALLRFELDFVHILAGLFGADLPCAASAHQCCEAMALLHASRRHEQELLGLAVTMLDVGGEIAEFETPRSERS